MAADVTPAGDAQALSDQLKQLAQSPEVVAEADSAMAACRAIDLFPTGMPARKR